MQALYQWQHTTPPSDELIQQFLEEQEKDQIDLEYFKTLVKGTIDCIDEIDADIKPTLDRDIKDLNEVDNLS